MSPQCLNQTDRYLDENVADSQHTESYTRTWKERTSTLTGMKHVSSHAGNEKPGT